MHDRIWIQGRPATYSTTSEQPWKNQILTQMEGIINQTDSLDLEFRLPISMYFMKGYDLDNLCDPVFTVLTSKMGWYDMDQTNIRGWRAVKKPDAASGLWIKQIQDVDVSIDPSTVVFDAKYNDKLPKGAEDPELPNWLFSKGEVRRVFGVCGLALIFVNINRSIASLSVGLVKHVIDCLYPILGGLPGYPKDHKITELIVKREKSDENARYVRIIVWSDPEEYAIVTFCESCDTRTITDEERISFKLADELTGERFISGFRLSSIHLDALLLAVREKATYLCDDLFFRKVANWVNVRNLNFVSLLEHYSNWDYMVPIIMELSKTNYLYIPLLARDDQEAKELYQNVLTGEKKRWYYGEVLRNYYEAIKR